ncbi:PREDICTED: mucin-2-like [Populus euphratica]|uniref:Mucin-2-like n=1 Tax=Populus euphratica TaxID=75702 RepID=A0AAJ6VFV1_POPEU|nr:PREDICTED: mucin-2-like [Populus euphratica]
MVMKEKDEELTLFLEMRRREIEREKNNLLLNSSADEPQAPLGLGSNDLSLVSNKITVSSIVPPPRKTATEKFLDSENDKSDYDWLLTPPGTPLFTSLELESQKTAMSQIGMSNVRPTALKSRLINIQEEPASRTHVGSKGTTLQSGLNSTSAGNRRSASAGGQRSVSRPATPTGRPSLSATAKHSRPSTPTSRPTLSSTKSVAPPARSSTPTRIAARSSTPTARPSLSGSKSASRSATPIRQSSTPSSPPSVAAAPGQTSSATKSVPATLKNPVPSRGISPSLKSRPWKPEEIPGFSLDAPPNLRTSLLERPASATRDRPGGPSARPASATRERPGGPSARPASASRERPGGPSARPASASRGRPGGPSARSSSSDAGFNGRPRQQSCSPSRGKASRMSIPSKSRTQTNGGDDVNPVQMGTKMVERVVNMRKLVPPKQDGSHSSLSNSAGKSSSLDSTGFGRTLSKKSLDMALRHMDIRRSISGNLRPLMTNIPASSMYSVRSGGSSKGRTVSVSDSPLATSSNASSEPSVNNNSYFADGIEIEDNEFGSDRGNSSPSSQHFR